MESVAVLRSLAKRMALVQVIGRFDRATGEFHHMMHELVPCGPVKGLDLVGMGATRFAECGVNYYLNGCAIVARAKVHDVEVVRTSVPVVFKPSDMLYRNRQAFVELMGKLGQV